MNKFAQWFYNFMLGRYGFDEYGRALGIRTIVLFIVSIVASVLASIIYYLAHVALVANLLNLVGSILNWVAIAFLVYMVFRMLSHNIDKRREENERYLSRRRKRQQHRDDKNYAYLNCQFCGQRLRVPKGKGKIAVKCPACGEKTIYNS
ncbi:MAG: hypothetical protein ACOX69_00205 [Coriobacteriales bacterium]|jgi:predicted RNA-binding Zn-ribbon protein involved in translation (DUF1610 family)